MPGVLNRRDFLKCCSAGGLGLYPALALAAQRNGGGPLAPRPSHFPARARNLIFVFLTGGFSHVDTFDYKPKLQKDHGKKVVNRELRDTSDKAFYLIRSPFQFAPRGRSGLMISELFPHLGALADDLCVIRTLHTDILEHFQATLAMHTGSATVPMPSLGSWLSYGLGTFNQNLPAYTVMAEHLPYAGAQVWDSNFLPPYHQQLKEAEDFFLSEMLAIDFGLDESGEEVVGGIFLARGDHGGEIVVHGGGDGDKIVDGALGFWAAGAGVGHFEDGVAPAFELGPVGGGDADHVGDDFHRKGNGVLGGEVELGGVVIEGVVEELAGEGADEIFEVADHAGGEGLGDDGAELGVPRGVEEDEPVARGGDAGGEVFVIGENALDAVVVEDAPGVEGWGDFEDGGEGADLGVEGIGVAADGVGEEVHFRSIILGKDGYNSAKQRDVDGFITSRCFGGDWAGARGLRSVG